jgi:hypothetical protein
MRGRCPSAVLLLIASPLLAHAESTASGGRRPKDSWTLQVGLAHSKDGADHYVVSGFQARLPVWAFDRRRKTDRLGTLGVEIGMYPYPVIGRAYVPGVDADPETPGKHNFWEALGLSYYSPRFGPLQLEAGARMAFVNRAERVLTSPNGCGAGNRTEPRCNEYIKESFKTLDTILLPSFRGGRGAVGFVAGALVVKGIGARVEWARLNGSGVNASGWRFGLTVR